MSEPSLALELDNIPPSFNGREGVLRMHWAKRQKVSEGWQYRVKSLVNQRPPKGIPYKRCVILYTVYGVREQDWDNLSSTYKFIGDGLVNAGVLVDDNPGCVLAWFPLFHKVSSFKEEHIVIEVYETPGEYPWQLEVEKWVRSVLAGMPATATP